MSIPKVFGDVDYTHIAGFHVHCAVRHGGDDETMAAVEATA